MRSARLFLLLAIALPLPSQTFDASRWQQGTTTIDSPWRFHPGDDPRWVSPDFDDSSWPLLKSGQYWTNQGYRGYSGYAWYRLRLKLPATTQPLGINIGHVNSTAEIYADGQLIGANGIMRPQPQWSAQAEANAFALPPSANGHWIEIAVRVWKSPVASSYNGGGFRIHPVVGSLSLIQSGRRVAIDNGVATNISALTADLLCLVLGCFGLGLFLFDRRNTEYAWFAVWAIGSSLLDVLRVVLRMHQGSITFVDGDRELLKLPFYFAELLFLWGFLKIRRDWILLVAALLDVAGVVCYSLAFYGILYLPVGQALQTGFFALAFILVIARVLLSMKGGNRDARLLILPVILLGLGNFIEGIQQALYFAGLSTSPAALIFWSNGIVTVDWNDVFQVLQLIAIAIALMLRFTRASQEERRLSTELAAAREVQARLVPAMLPALGTARLEAAYIPATEVGGDFYQVFPLPDSTVLIVIGDVSGKGLKAAMTGTLALGALRSLAQENPSPSEMLTRLNAQLAASPDGGFITCLCVRIAADGAVTLANAGHLAPYRNGEEVECKSGLPLGIEPRASYMESVFMLAPGDTLTFLSDGVVEARNATGELFGFDRARSCSTQTADQIACAARAFGQEDDITVLTFTRLTAETMTQHARAILEPVLDSVKP